MQSLFNDYKNKHINKNLYREYVKLKYKLIDLYEEWYLLNSSVKSRLLLNYQNHFGDLETELNKKEKEAETIKSLIDSISFKKISEPKKNEKINMNNIDSFTSPFQSSQKDISKTYKNIVKIIHPDINQDFDKYSKIWDIVQLAYEKKEANKLENIFEIIQENPDFDNNEIKSKIRKLNNQISIEEFRLEKLKTFEPFSFEKSLKDEEWIKSRKTELYHKIHRLEKKIDFRKKILDSLKDKNRFMRHKSKIN